MQVAGHMLQHGQLLAVLFPKTGQVRPHRVEQAFHHVHHALEMARPAGALEDLIQPAQVIVTRGEAGVQIIRCRGEQGSASGLAQQLGILLQLAWIVGQVVLVVELQGVHEHRAYHEVCQFGRPVQQGQVAGMQGAHRRHEAYPQASSACIGRPSGHGGGRRQEFHDWRGFLLVKGVRS